VLEAKRVPLSTHYCVGVPVVNEENGQVELHLTPLNYAASLQPDFRKRDELNAQERSRKEQEARDQADEMAALDDEKEVPAAADKGAGGAEATRATVSLVPRETARQAESRKQSYEYMVAEAAREEFRPLDVKDHRLSEQMLLCTTPAERARLRAAPVPENIDWDELAARLYPGTRRSTSWTRPGASQQARSQAALSRLSLVEQVAQIMRQEQTLHFSSIAEKASRVVDDGGLIDALVNVAVLVRGRWIAKSNLVCGGNHVLEAARNYILYSFAVAGSDADGDGDANVARSDEAGVAVAKVAAELLLLPERVHGLLSSFAVKLTQNPGVYSLRLDRDRDFCARFPKVVESYETFWRDCKDAVLASLTQIVRGISKETEKGVHFELGVRHDAINFIRKYDVGGATPSEQLRSFLVAMFTQFGVCSWRLLETTLESLKVDNTMAPLIGPDRTWTEELRDELAVEAIALQPDVFCRKSLDNDKIDPFRDVIIKMFVEQQPNANPKEFKRSEIMEYLRPHEMAGISNATYTRILREIAQSEGAKWVLKKGTGIDADE
jgi:hypothetical protein